MRVHVGKIIDTNGKTNLDRKSIREEVRAVILSKLTDFKIGN